MRFVAGEKYKIVFIGQSKPDKPTIEEILKRVDGIGFSLAGEIDGIVILNSEDGDGVEFELVRATLPELEEDKNYAIVHFKSEKPLERVPYKNGYLLFLRRDGSFYEYLIFCEYTFFKEIDEFWNALYEVLNVENDKTYCVFRIFKKP